MSVQTDELGVVEVHRMPLKDYAELLRALKNLPGIISKFTDDKNDVKDFKDAELFELIRDVLIESWDDLIDVIAVPTNKTGDELGLLDGADAIDVIDAILELNDIVRIVNAVKKISARAQAMQAARKAPN